ncbi:MAG: hypothetical protein JWR58_672 [Pseudonocardia sp.]|nr:hypothetical protein [Pseudonocardia sp.]
MAPRRHQDRGEGVARPHGRAPAIFATLGLRSCRSDEVLTRGYVVRRSWLASIGGFAEEPELDDLVDHDFWFRTAVNGGKTELIRTVGARLWERGPVTPFDEFEPSTAARLLRERAGVGLVME